MINVNTLKSANLFIVFIFVKIKIKCVKSIFIMVFVSYYLYTSSLIYY